MIFRKFLLVCVCLLLASCFGQSDDAGFRREITSDARILGNWTVQKWLDDKPVCPNCSSIVAFEEQQHNGKTVYKMVSSNAHFLQEVKEFLTVYRFGDANYAYTGYPDVCTNCTLVKYEVRGDTLTVYTLKDLEAVSYLQKTDPQKTRFAYEKDVSDVTVRVLDEQSKAMLSELARQSNLWTASIIMKR